MLPRLQAVLSTLRGSAHHRGGRCTDDGQTGRKKGGEAASEIKLESVHNV